MIYAAAIMLPTGLILYYTGRAGAEYLSSNPADAFYAFTRERAMKKAEEFCAVRNAGLAAEHKPMAIPMPGADSEGGDND